MIYEPCRFPGCTSTYAGDHTWHVAPIAVETYRVVQLTPAGETLAILITGCSVREARTIAADLGAGFHVRQDPPSAVATARAA